PFPLRLRLRALALTGLGWLRSRGRSPRRLWALFSELPQPLSNHADYGLQLRIRIFPQLDEARVIVPGLCPISPLLVELAKPLVARRQLSGVVAERF